MLGQDTETWAMIFALASYVLFGVAAVMILGAALLVLLGRLRPSAAAPYGWSGLTVMSLSTVCVHMEMMARAASSAGYGSVGQRFLPSTLSAIAGLISLGVALYLSERNKRAADAAEAAKP
jgi:hypothetical protein